MDYSLPFVELLHDQMQAGPRAKKHIIHFRSKKEFHACLEGLKRYKTSNSTLFSVRSLKLIHAISCPLLSESKLLKHPSIAGFEEDYQVTVHEVRKSKKSWPNAPPWLPVHRLSPGGSAISGLQELGHAPKVRMSILELLIQALITAIRIYGNPYPGELISSIDRPSHMMITDMGHTLPEPLPRQVPIRVFSG